jgi:hypothetical protein
MFKMCAKFLLAGIKAQLDDDGGRILLGDNTGGGAVVLRPIRSTMLAFDFQLNPLLYTHTHI